MSGSTTTGARTIADLFPRAAERYADRACAKVKRDGVWREVTYTEAGVAVSEIGRGLLDLGVQPADRVAVLCTTRLEWRLCAAAISAAGAGVVTIYPTCAPSECEWVVRDSESVFVLCENAAQVTKIREARGSLPALRLVIVVEGEAEGAISLQEVRELGRRRGEDELRRRYKHAGVDDLYMLIYTSGTTGNPKGVFLSHGNYRSMLEQVALSNVLTMGLGDTL